MSNVIRGSRYTPATCALNLLTPRPPGNGYGRLTSSLGGNSIDLATAKLVRSYETRIYEEIDLPNQITVYSLGSEPLPRS